NPSSPVSKRFTSTFPSEPVPPVTTILLSLSTIHPPKFLVRRRIGSHLLDHLGPRGGLNTGRLAKKRTVQTTVADERFIRLDLDGKSVSLLDQREKVKFADGLAGEMPDAA